MSQNTRVDLRLPEDLKETVKNVAKEKNSDFSAYTRDALQEKLYRESAEYQISQTMFNNKIINILNAYPKVNPELKAAIIKELKDHEA